MGERSVPPTPIITRDPRVVKPSRLATRRDKRVVVAPVSTARLTVNLRLRVTGTIAKAPLISTATWNLPRGKTVTASGAEITGSAGRGEKWLAILFACSRVETLSQPNTLF